MDAWLVVSYTVGAALARMALLDVETVLEVVAAVERGRGRGRGRCRRERGLSLSL